MRGRVNETMTFDVVVVGGGAAGASAAVAAAQSGASVCLIERYGFLGGAAVASSVLTYCGFFDRNHDQVVAGVGQQFLDRLDSQNAYFTHTSADSGNKIVLLDPEITKRAFDELVVNAGVTVFFHAQLVSAQVDDGRVESVDFVHLGGVSRVFAHAFVDCSGDGALIHAAGIPTEVSPISLRQASTQVIRVGRVAPDADLDRDSVTSAVAAYRAEHSVDLPRDYGTFVRLPVSNEIMVLIADQHKDMLDATQASLAEIESRTMAVHYFRALRNSVNGWGDSFLSATGPTIGIRETRHLVGADALSRSDVADARKQPDTVVARGGWPMESHVVPGHTGYEFIRDDGYYDIPYGALYSPHSCNVWSGGRLISADGQAFSSVRVMGTAFGTGHASGAAAAQFAKEKYVDVAELQQALRAQGALL